MIQECIHQCLTEVFSPQHLSIVNDSHLHAGSNTNSHFKVLLVSEAFINLSSVKRHQQVYQALKTIMPKIHALQLNTWTPKEWNTKTEQAAKDIPSSQCAKS